MGTRDQWGAMAVALQPQLDFSGREGRRIRNVTFFLFGMSPCMRLGACKGLLQPRLKMAFESLGMVAGSL